MKTEKTTKTFAISQVISLILEIFSISALIGGMAIFSSNNAEALDIESVFPAGCCIEANDGSICQNMNLFDASLCKTQLIVTKCEEVDNCRIGCCYSKEEGICSYNSPKEKCERTNGNWSEDDLCQIPECYLGCCVLRDEAAITTSRECTLKSRDLGLEKDFQSLDADGTCNSKIRLAKEGACTWESDDFSGENECKFTTKSDCLNIAGEFYDDYLCTSKELNTTCFPAKNTTCAEDYRIYYLDTCGNTANIYDSSKYDDEDYWEKIIEAGDSCTASAGDADCGNCDYLRGSMCFEYREDKDREPVYGNYVCRDLSCINGRGHGESWCISDYSNTDSAGVAPVGSRWFRGTCLFGEVTVEPCADFNQEVCIEGEGGGGFSEAQCTTNQWRSCLAANDYDSYDDVETECERLSDYCVMFLDMEGTGGNSSNSTYEGLPGFFDGGTGTKNRMTAEGNVGDVGKNANGDITYCVPKYTPGTVFWTQSDTDTTSYGLSYGGSYTETKALCSLGNFICVAEEKKKGTGWAADTDWTNKLCGKYGDAYTDTWVEALNERCRMLGPCGIQVNIAGELGSNNENANSSFSQIYINEDGDIGTAYTPTIFDLDDSYIEGLAENADRIAPGSLTSLAQAIILSLITGKATSSTSSSSYSGPTESEATTAASAAAAKAPKDPMEWYVALGAGVGAAISWQSVVGFSGKTATTYTVMTSETLGSWGTTIGLAAVAALAGYAVGQLTAKWFGFDSNAEIKTFSEALALGAASGVLVAKLILSASWTKSGGWASFWGLVAAALIAYWYYVTQVKEYRYWITRYECKVWQPPTGGNCALCNNDVRPCSEYRCRSLGTNCHYFSENGEPGWCAELSDIWSATISPWPEALTEGFSYSGITDSHFSITKDGGEVPAWTGIDFGVITSKQAVCKIDSQHTETYDEMRYTMVIDDTVGCEAGQCVNQGTHHKFALSPYYSESATVDAGTIQLTEGENEFYIRCRNYAGQYNRAEFAVRVNVGSGPDLSPPVITSFNPESGSYAKLGANTTSLMLYVNEPAECRYSQGSNARFEEMTKKLTCMSSGGSAYLGNWPCYGTLSNLTVGENKFYFQCRDQPDLLEEQSSMRNINRNSKEYVVKVCERGLNITSLSPENKIVTGKSPVSLEIQAKTEGCVDGGRAICSYMFENSTQYIDFYETNALTHKQIFTSMPEGNFNISIRCEDEAGNYDEKYIYVQVELDNAAPIVTRSYVFDKKLVIITNENSECKFISNETVGCDFDYDSAENITLMAGASLSHSTPRELNKNYYIKCSDEYGNVNSDCGIAIKTY